MRFISIVLLTLYFFAGFSVQRGVAECLYHNDEELRRDLNTIIMEAAKAVWYYKLYRAFAFGAKSPPFSILYSYRVFNLTPDGTGCLGTDTDIVCFREGKFFSLERRFGSVSLSLGRYEGGDKYVLSVVLGNQNLEGKVVLIDTGFAYKVDRFVKLSGLFEASQQFSILSRDERFNVMYRGLIRDLHQIYNVIQKKCSVVDFILAYLVDQNFAREVFDIYVEMTGSGGGGRQ